MSEAGARSGYRDNGMVIGELAATLAAELRSSMKPTAANRLELEIIEDEAVTARAAGDPYAFAIVFHADSPADLGSSLADCGSAPLEAFGLYESAAVVVVAPAGDPGGACEADAEVVGSATAAAASVAASHSAYLAGATGEEEDEGPAGQTEPAGGSDEATRPDDLAFTERLARVEQALRPPSGRPTPESEAQEDSPAGRGGRWRSWLRRPKEQSSSAFRRRVVKRLDRPTVALLGACEMPAVAVVGNNKGGVGKTSTAVNLAATLAELATPVSSEGAPHEGASAAPVLIIEQNYENPDICSQLSVGGAPAGGLLDFAADLSAGRARDLLDYTRSVEGHPNLDVLSIGAATDRSYYEAAGRISYETLIALYERVAEYYAFVVVDLDKGLPQAMTMASEVSRFWLSAATAVYVVVRGKDGVRHATEYVHGVRRICEEDGLKAPPVVEILNDYCPSDPGTEAIEAGLRATGADIAISAFGEPFLRIPRDDRMDSFARERRPIALISPALYDAFVSVGVDFIERAVEQIAEFSGGRPPENSDEEEAQ